MTSTPPWYNPPSPWEAALEHGGPWTEEDFNALPEGVRAELHDGNLILNPSPEPSHQFAQRVVALRLSDGVGDPKRVLETSDVRMADGKRYRAPDVIAVRKRYDKRPADPANVLLVVEVVSPGGGDEWTTKMEVYAQARIPGYLIVAQKAEGFAAWHHVLRKGKYVLAGSADPGGVLHATEPFEFSLDLAELE